MELKVAIKIIDAAAESVKRVRDLDEYTIIKILHALGPVIGAIYDIEEGEEESHYCLTTNGVRLAADDEKREELLSRIVVITTTIELERTSRNERVHKEIFMEWGNEIK